LPGSSAEALLRHRRSRVGDGRGAGTTLGAVDAHRLRLLRELGDRGSVSAVAEALQVTPSAVSQQLATLQASARVPLTERDGRRLVLTQAGKALAEAGVAVAKALAEADSAVERFLDREHAPVRISAFHSAALAMFGPLLHHARGQAPCLMLADEDVAQHEFPRLTADYDLVIAHRLPHQPGWPEDRVEVVHLLSEPIDVVMSRSHALARKELLEPQDLVHQKWVAVHAGFPLRGVLDQVAGSAGRPAQVLHEVNDFSVVAEIVAATPALAILPRTVGVDDRLVRRPVRGLSLRRNIDVLARPENLEKASVRRVLELLQGVVAGLPLDHDA